MGRKSNLELAVEQLAKDFGEFVTQVKTRLDNIENKGIQVGKDKPKKEKPLPKYLQKIGRGNLTKDTVGNDQIITEKGTTQIIPMSDDV